mgnify:CR=1 FL=1
MILITLCLILMLLGMIGLCLYFLFDTIKNGEKDIIKVPNKPLFEERYVYIKNSNEDNMLICENSDSPNLERWGLTYRGLVRMATATYFSPQEYQEYRTKVLAKELP